MLKFIITKDKKFNGLLYKGRKVVADEKFLERLVKVPEAIVYSSWRSLAEQKVLFNAGKSKTLASNHRRGMAVDVINWIDVQDKMKKVGLINDISWDKNHFAYDGESKAAKYPLIDKLPSTLKEFRIEAIKAPVSVPKVENIQVIPIKIEKPQEVKIKQPEHIAEVGKMVIPEIRTVEPIIPEKEVIIEITKDPWIPESVEKKTPIQIIVNLIFKIIELCKQNFKK
jgi:hypothetical protein